ncbi:hypothetical protein PsYK624_007630 [Phanerochaete sordida]|uniref:Protein kinase domain-containing protein n=1 Tax=Phanerochaete sordida TaxID=48140 RepID=A0A9P3L8H4_9APHY|nr:hypothetical protein PsYK624_007630 [Phanerochaete sordida]
MSLPESTTAHRAIDLLLAYPEQNPFDFQPPIYNLTPREDPLESFDTPELKAAALAIAQRTAVNVVMKMHGTNPLLAATSDRNRAEAGQTPMTAYQRPPPLSEATLPETIEFIDELNQNGHRTIFVVRLNNELRVLKVYPDRTRYPNSSEPDPRESFDNEARAYAHLLHYGACAKGTVPMCFGWSRLSEAHVQAILDMPDLSDHAADLEFENGELPKVIVLEYFPKAETMSIANVTRPIADKALRALHDIHAAYVEHGDIHGRSILVLPEERVVWINFNSSRTASARKFTRSELFTELRQAWDYFYMSMIPDKRIGFTQWVG